MHEPMSAKCLIADILLTILFSPSARPISVFGMLMPERLRGFEIDNQFGLRGLLNR